MINQTKPIHMQWPFAIDSIQDNIAWSSPGLWMDAWRQSQAAEAVSNLNNDFIRLSS